MFGRTATKLIAEVKSKVPGVQVAHNLEKPRKGAFVVTVRGKAVLTLLDLPRPFKKLREISVDELAADCVTALK